MKRGYHVAIITGGRGRSLTVRFEMLGVEHVYTNCFHKIDALHELMQKLDVQAEEILYMGDDIPDIEPMLHVGMRCARPTPPPKWSKSLATFRNSKAAKGACATWWNK